MNENDRESCAPYLNGIQCEFKKDSNLNLSKSKRKIIKLLSVDDSIFHMVYIPYIGRSYIGSGMAAQQSLL